MNFIKLIVKLSFFSTIIFHLNSCGIYRPTDAQGEFPPEPKKRVKKI